MDQYVKELAGILVAIVLVADGLLHAYWATGRLWPAQNKLSLAKAVLNINKTRSFRPAVLVPLACLLFCGALIMLARVHYLGMFGQLIPSPLLQLGVLSVAVGLLLRGLAGIVWALRLAASRSEMFYKLNLIVYTPVCLVLFVAAAAAASF
ncbi:DUF3995 domain-containing protein [Ktedonobacter racemifer]|uniref:DUF3995 domain-containing protein n=1 Tax=Ktedonobacter racemifer DSM 44963 TaxID=485913 RepID=D6U154_KTERA|nr:DUF3995 domain-containing protein [Ktedonobacter racemifer]EFH82544.1 conserved hypothetical protein [Ktedonobacter racemifer DSM 44963]